MLHIDDKASPLNPRVKHFSCKSSNDKILEVACRIAIFSWFSGEIPDPLSETSSLSNPFLVKVISIEVAPASIEFSMQKSYIFLE